MYKPLILKRLFDGNELVDETSDVKLRSIEIFLVNLSIGIVLVFSFLDIIYDLYTEGSKAHLAADSVLSLALLFTLTILLRRTKRTHSRVATLQTAFFESKKEVEKTKRDFEKSLEDKRQLLRGLGECIDAQLEKWKLSAAEKEIALLLLKGLSHREIAEIRETSERTVRQQSLSVYSKSGLKGRSDLAAFFLEDMLAPIGPQRPKPSSRQT